MTAWCGCGGGWDCFGCIPFLGAQDVIINLSFTLTPVLLQTAVKHPRVPGLFWVEGLGAKTGATEEAEYFPESRLSRALGGRRVYVIDYGGLFHHEEDEDGMVIREGQPLSALLDAYRVILEDHPEVIDWVLVDGGCDVLVRGDELGLGTPQEDLLSLKCSFELSKLLQNLRTFPPSLQLRLRSVRIVCLGANIDSAHGISGEDIKHLLQLASSKQLLNKNDEKCKTYIATVMKCKPQQSIIHSLVVSAILGKRGYFLPDWLRKKRGLRANRVFLDEMTCTAYWFDLKEIAQRSLLLPGICLGAKLLEYDDYLGDAHERSYTEKCLRDALSSEGGTPTLQLTQAVAALVFEYKGYFP